MPSSAGKAAVVDLIPTQIMVGQELKNRQKEDAGAAANVRHGAIVEFVGRLTGKGRSDRPLNDLICDEAGRGNDATALKYFGLADDLDRAL